uniref:Uncharacterized protein n=1 Tax=Rhizophora mucronata TaxID=61149 RepID=A0A2P2LX59_RHIMU
MSTENDSKTGLNSMRKEKKKKKSPLGNTKPKGRQGKEMGSRIYPIQARN